MRLPPTSTLHDTYVPCSGTHDHQYLIFAAAITHISMSSSDSTWYVGTMYVLKLLIVTSCPSRTWTQKKTTFNRLRSRSGRVQDVMWLVFCLKWGSGMFPDTSSYAKLKRLDPHNKSQNSIMGI